MHSAMIEGIVALAEEFTVERSTIQSRVVFTGNMLDYRYIHPFRNVLELFHALRMNVLVLGIVSQITGKQDEVRTSRQGVDHLDSALERASAEWIGRSVEADMCVAELDKGKWRNLLATIS